MKNPWKQLLKNVHGGQAWNSWHSERGCNRPVKSISITEEDIRRIYKEQNGLSKWLKLPLDPMKVFVPRHPLSPSVDRLDNEKEYTPDNICICTRFENYGLNRCSDSVRDECIDIIVSSIKKTPLNLENFCND